MPGRGFSPTESYRYGFNGQEKDDEIRGNGNALDFGGRSIYDSRLGRFVSIDPRYHSFPFMSPYCYAANRPIDYVDQHGEGPIKYRYYIFNQTTGEPILLLEQDGEDDRLSNEVVYKTYMERQYTDVHGSLDHNFQEIQSSWLAPGETMESYLKYIGENRMPAQDVDGHAVLDFVGLVPVLGEAADGINAAWYYIEGDYVNGSFSAVAVIPILGTGATVGKWSSKALKLMGNNELISKAGLVFGKATKEYNRLTHVLKHTANDLTKPFHGVFTIADGDLISVLDNAWEQIKTKAWDNTVKDQTVDGIRRIVGDNGNVSYIIDAGKKVGFEGGKKGSGQVLTKIQITIEKGTKSNVVTSFPTK